MQSLLRLILVLLFAAAPLVAGVQGAGARPGAEQAAHEAGPSEHGRCPDHHAMIADEAAGLSCELIAGHCAAAMLPQREMAGLHRAPVPTHLPSAPAPALDPSAPELETPPPRS